MRNEERNQQIIRSLTIHINLLTNFYGQSLLVLMQSCSMKLLTSFSRRNQGLESTELGIQGLKNCRELLDELLLDLFTQQLSSVLLS
jgi:hypothetical protein